MHAIEEMTYFLDEEYKASDYDFVTEYYENYYDEKLVTGAKNVGVAVSENAIKRLQIHNPLCKIILVVRNPIKRAYSAYWYCRRMGWEDAESFDVALTKPLEAYPSGVVRRNCDYIGQSSYISHLEVMRKYFPDEQIKVYVLEEDFKDMGDLNADLCEFIGVPVVYFNEEIYKKSVNASAMPRHKWLVRFLKSKSIISVLLKKIIPSPLVRKIKNIKERLVKLNEVEFVPPPMTDDAREKLIKIFEDKNSKLEVLLNRKLDVWSD
jgi:hypothetical protein